MVISDFAIKRPMITTVTMVALVVFGLFALWRLQTDEFPDIQQPVVLTFIPYPGASPEGVERELLKPVEDAIKGISGVDKIYGTAGDGYAQIITLFLFEKDPQVATQDNLDERTIRLQGRLEGPQDFDNLVVAERNGQIVRLGQVADAIDGTEEQRTLALYNGAEAVGINIVKAKGYSTTDVSKKVRAKVAEIQKTLPAGVKLDIVKDSGVRVHDSVRHVIEALIIGELLTYLVVFVFLYSWRS